MLDQLLGEAAGAGRKPGMTGTLTVRYRRPTPLGALRGEARIDRVEGIKTFVVGAPRRRRRRDRRGRGRLHPARVGTPASDADAEPAPEPFE